MNAGLFLKLISVPCLSFAFVIAGARKILEVGAFARAISSYHLLPEPLVRPAAWGIVLSEITLGIFLFLGSLQTMALIGLSVLMVLFTGAVGINLARGNKVSCGCFGSGSGKLGWETVVHQSLVMLLLVISLAVSEPAPIGVLVKEGHVAEVVTALVLAVGAIVSYLPFMELGEDW